ncbi:MAG: cyanophycinase, partial [Flammeovirgaceae bacterium]|nr:cyanophycinase [Flammeovirgaceae bacterium]
MKQLISKFTKTIFLLFISFSLLAQGKLLLVGGGGEKSGGWSDTPYAAAINAAANKKVAIISVNDETNVLPNYFLSLGAVEAINVKIDSYTEANKQSTYDLLMGYDMIFIKGGNQANYYDYYKNSKTQEALRDKFLAGGVLGGTSAGAMILSGVISLETVYPNETLENINNPYVELVDDFLQVMDGFLVDTHFIERGRFARLLPFMAKWKQDTGESVTGIGIDDQTAIFIDHNKIGTVYGTASVAVYPASETSKFNILSNRLYTSSPVRHIALTHGDVINLNTLAITYSYSSTIIPTYTSETRTQVLYLGGGITLNDNQPLLQEFAKENNLTDEILIVTETSVTRANQFKTALHNEGVPTVNIKQQNGALSMLDPDWEAKVASAQKIIIMEVTYQKFMDFLNSTGGASLNTKIQNQSIPIALIGENANLAGRRVATRVKEDVYAAYDGLLGFNNGLGLLQSVIVVSNTFFSGTSYRDYYENKSCAVPYGMLIQDAKYGLWLSPTNWAKITSNGSRRDLVVRGTSTGTTPGLLLANSNAGTIGRATPFQYFNNSLNMMVSRSVVGYNDLRITYMYPTYKYDLNGGAPEEIKYFPPALTEIYWIDSDDKKIYKSVNRGAPQVIAASGVAGTGIAYNPHDGKIYATNATGNASRSIVRMNLDGSNFETFLNSTELNNQDPNMIAIDPDNGDIYYSIRASNPRRIAKVSMDKTTHVTNW